MPSAVESSVARRMAAERSASGSLMGLPAYRLTWQSQITNHKSQFTNLFQSFQDRVGERNQGLVGLAGLLVRLKERLGPILQGRAQRVQAGRLDDRVREKRA